jgi:hypothetical protein
MSLAGVKPKGRFAPFSPLGPDGQLTAQEAPKIAV